VRLDGGHIGQPEGAHTRSERRVGAVARVHEDDPARDLRLKRLPDLIERDLRLGLEDDTLRHARLPAPRRIGGPVLGQIKAVGDRQAGRVVGHRQGYGDLAIILLAQLAGVLAGNPDRVPALLGKARVVDDPGLDRPAALERRQGQPAHLREHRLVRPGGLTHEVQKRLVLGGNARWSGDGRHRLHALALGRHEQPGAVVAERRGPISVADDAHQRLDERGKPCFAASITEPGHACACSRTTLHTLRLPPNPQYAAL